MLMTPERKVPQRSDASQNDHKSKGHSSKTSEEAFTMQKADKIDLNRLKQTFKSPTFLLQFIPIFCGRSPGIACVCSVIRSAPTREIFTQGQNKNFLDPNGALSKSKGNHN